MRITRTLLALALLATSSVMVPVMAQDGKGDAAPPPPPTLGPRKGAQKQEKPAAQQGQRPPQAETISTHGKWLVQCTPLPGNAGKACGMIQQTKSTKSENLGVSVIVRKVKQGDKTTVFMQVMAPIGVFLPTGVPIEIDGNALPKAMVFSRCIPPICEATGEASADTLNKFRRGSNATFYVYDRPGNGFPLPISLEGFDAALKALDKL